VNWRRYKQFPYNHPLSLRLADRLGRGRGRARWLDGVRPPPPPPRRLDLSRWERHEFAAAWIGHATTLLRIAGKTILTDPAMMNRVGLGLGVITAGAKRLYAPAVSIAGLPALDVILLSHAHFDHLDRPTLHRLPKHVPVIVAARNRDLVADLGFNSVTELKWGQSARIDGLAITACEVKHWGARAVLDVHRGYGGFVIEGAGRRILYGGDSAYHERFRELGKMDMAVLGIGAYDPWIQSHANPEQAWAMADHVRAEHVFPIHHSTFTLSKERREEPIERLLDAAGAASDRVVIREIGGVWAA
jgi:L-ascorbate metabolism protein UlaG (beta-lactamase superfamily)